MTKNRTLAKELISDIPTKKTARQIQNMDFPIEGSKIKVVVESSVTYQNLSAEKYKTNGKGINSIRLTQYKRKVEKPSETTTDGTSDGFWDFSLTRLVGLSQFFFHWSCIFLLIGFDMSNLILRRF